MENLENLYEQAEKGLSDEDAISIITQMQPKLYVLSGRYLSRREDREEAVQECLLKAWQKRGTIRRPQAFPAWMMRVLYNECMSIGRRINKEPQWCDSGEPFAESDLDQRMEYEEAVQALNACGLAVYETVCLHYQEGYSYREIAQMLCTPVGTLVSRVRRSLIRVKEELRAS